MLEKIKEILKTAFWAFWLFMANLLIYSLFYPHNTFIKCFSLLASFTLVVIFCKGYNSIALGISGAVFVIGLFVYIINNIDNMVSGLNKFALNLYNAVVMVVPYIVIIAIFFYFIGRIIRGGRGSTNNRKSSTDNYGNSAADDSFDRSEENDENNLDFDGSCVDGYLFKGCNPYHPTLAIGYVNRDGYVFRKGSMTHNSHAVGYVSGELIYVTGSSYPVACIKKKRLYSGSMPDHETRAIAHMDGKYIFEGASSEHSTYADANYDGKSSYGLAAYYLLMM